MVEAPPLNIRIRPVDDAAELVVAGDIDAMTAHVLRDALADAQHHFGAITVDLAGVDFIDSAGLGALVGGWRRAAARQEAFALRAPSGTVRRNLEISGLARIFTIVD